MTRMYPGLSQEEEDALTEYYRQMPITEKVLLVGKLIAEGIAEEEAKIRAQYGPDISDHEVKLRRLSRQVDRETMIKAFGWDPEAQG